MTRTTTASDGVVGRVGLEHGSIVRAEQCRRLQADSGERRKLMLNAQAPDKCCNEEDDKEESKK